MAYIEGVDYWVRLVEFPNMASPSVAVSNGDGTFTIYVNSRFSPEKRAAGLRHELEHLEGQHFYRDDVELGELEAAADGKITLGAPAAGGGKGDRIPLYRDCDAFLEDFIGKASPASLELLRRGGLDLPEGAGKSPPGRGGASGPSAKR